MDTVILAISASLLLMAYQSYITYRVLTNRGLSRGQKIGQCVLVWVLPLIGTAVVHIMLGLDMELQRADHGFTPQPPNDGGGGHIP